MNDSYFISMPWPKRQQSRRQCAERINLLLTKLEKIDSRLGNLYEVGNSIDRPVGNKILFETNYVEKALKADSKRSDLGYKLYVVYPDESFNIVIEDGVYCDVDPIINWMSIRFNPHDNTELFDFLNVNMLSSILAVIDEVYQPPYIRVYSSFHSTQCNIKGIYPFVGWMLYLRKSKEKLPRLPEGVDVREFGKDGCLIITTQELFTVEKEDHILIAAETNKRLKEAGILDEFNPYRK